MMYPTMSSARRPTMFVRIYGWSVTYMYASLERAIGIRCRTALTHQTVGRGKVRHLELPNSDTAWLGCDARPDRDKVHSRSPTAYSSATGRCTTKQRLHVNRGPLPHHTKKTGIRSPRIAAEVENGRARRDGMRKRMAMEGRGCRGIKRGGPVKTNTGT